MKNKLFMLIAGSLLSAMFLAGCTANDQEPPPNDDVDVENPAENDMDNNDMDNNDINTDDDGDMMEDENTPGEDAVEDNLDMNDKDNNDK